MTAQLRWPSTNQKIASSTRLSLGDMANIMPQAGYWASLWKKKIYKGLRSTVALARQRRRVTVVLSTKSYVHQRSVAG